MTVTEPSIPARFESIAAKYADRLAVRSPQGELRYAQLNSLANAVAREILDSLPCGTDGPETVAVVLPAGLEAIAALLATLKAGKIHVALNPRFPHELLAAQLADSQARLVVTCPAYHSVVASLGAARVLTVEIPRNIAVCADLDLNIPAEAPAAIQYTSGSTGVPKGVLTPHRNILHNAGIQAGAGALGRDDRLLPNRLLTSLNGLMTGASVFPYALKEDGLLSLPDWLRDNQVSVMSIVPAMFRRFAAGLSETEQLPHLRLIKLTGEPLYRGDVELFQSRFSPGCFLQFSFATTETAAVSVNLIGHDQKIERDLVPAGFAVSGKEILILDDEGNSLRAGETGEIAVRSRYISLGYWRKPELTRERFSTDPTDPEVRTYLTGDLGRIQPDGALVHLGRKDSQVKIRANRVELGEVEAALRSIDGVGDAVVVAQPDDSGETCLAAYFVPATNPAPPFGIVRRALSQKLPDYMVPSTVTSIPELPLLPNGKVDRRALPDPVRAPVRAPSAAPRTQMELLVAETWRQVLRIEQIGVSDNFFDLGGNSLKAIESSSLLERKTGVRLSPVSLAAQTLAQVAAVYAERNQGPRRGLTQTLHRFFGRREQP